MEPLVRVKGVSNRRILFPRSRRQRTIDRAHAEFQLRQSRQQGFRVCWLADQLSWSQVFEHGFPFPRCAGSRNHQRQA